ncbi:MAG TPA: hypothetical protein VHF22_06345, partial [Planctomycetota bacterium]|nr:hypothetical protein [Planctomycetota bacterium]
EVRRLVWGVVLGAARGAAGCGGDEEPAKDGGAAAEAKTGSKELRASLEKSVATIANALVNAPLDWDRTTMECTKYAADAKANGFNDLVQKLDGIKAEAKDAFEKAAEKEVADAIAQSKAYVAQGELKKARNRLVGVHRNVQKDDRYWPKVQDALDELALTERAETYYATVTKAKVEEAKSHEEWERAQGILEAFMAVPAFAASPRAKDVQATLATVKPEADKVRAARASEKSIKLTPAFKGDEKDLFKWELLGHEQMVTVADGVATFKYDGEDEGRKTAAIRFGEEDWEDYYVDVVFRVEKGAFRVNVHGFLDEEGLYNFQPGAGPIDAADFKDKDGWKKVHVEVHGKDLRYQVPGYSAVTKTLKSGKGPFEIRVDTGTVLKLKSVWVKVLKPVKQ